MLPDGTLLEHELPLEVGGNVNDHGARVRAAVDAYVDGTIVEYAGRWRQKRKERYGREEYRPTMLDPVSWGADLKQWFGASLAAMAARTRIDDLRDYVAFLSNVKAAGEQDAKG